MNVEKIVEEIHQSLKSAGFTMNGIREIARALDVRAQAVRDQAGSDREGPIAATIAKPGRGDAVMTSTGMKPVNAKGEPDPNGIPEDAKDEDIKVK